MIFMERVKTFLKRKNIQISARRYGIDALGAMAQGLFCSLLIGTILDTLGAQLGIEALVTIGGYASAMSGPAMAIAIGYALQAPPLVLFSLATVGYAANALGSTTLDGGKGAGGPLAVLFIAIIAAEPRWLRFWRGWGCPPGGRPLSAPLPPRWAASLCGPPICSPSLWASWCLWSSALP